MPKNEQDQVRHHDYDGIQEYDNQLPRWWVGTFVITVVFGFFYWLHYYVYEIGPNQAEEYHMAQKAHASEFKPKETAKAGLSDDQILKLLSDKTAMAEAKTVYDQTCAACHGAQGQGLIGPNLTDAYWIHGGQPTQIAQTIINGVPDKGMVPWKGVLTSAQIQKLSAYIISLKGTNPPGAKAPEGELVSE